MLRVEIRGQGGTLIDTDTRSLNLEMGRKDARKDSGTHFRIAQRGSKRNLIAQGEVYQIRFQLLVIFVRTPSD